MSALPGPDPSGPEPKRPVAIVEPGVELLERALSYTRGTLATVRTEHLCSPTPCTRWRLADLLAHMEDALDAFSEGATGAIDLRSTAPTPVEERIGSLQVKACGLLGAWAAATTPLVDVGGRPMPVASVSRLAAVEIAVHGWDVGTTTGCGDPLPDPLAEALMPTALALALEQPDQPDQHREFGDPVRVPADAGPARRLLGLLGRVAR
ncbi:TIGR03086 family metal-binding protein [Nocardioides sp. TF02-7]|uniref:TIGR03086 family metal-binding protein n=1 Tax=Nocardioides sp. TF02-7 TaxID=2917724 RepID=UPI001F0558BC|nr:TIGR03086 family metal-binding protein [Nocardioides sp. TF02-7]UMG94310.1 TIGR03086 family metal-binding protein [Nocardioides sp. TF02-7]